MSSQPSAPLPSQLPDLTYTRKGSGPVLVLLHGIGHRRQMWDPIIDELATRYDVIAPDLSGFGQSPAFAGGVEYSMDNAMTHMAGQFEKWGIERPHIVGNSLGGAIALELAARDLVASVTTLSPAGFFGPITRFQPLAALFVLRALALLTPSPMLRFFLKLKATRVAYGSFLYAYPERLTYENALGEAMSLKHATAFERTALQALFYSFKRPVRVPTTIAWASKDVVLPLSQFEIAKKRLPSASFVELADCGHVPVLDDPSAIVKIIDDTTARIES